MDEARAEFIIHRSNAGERVESEGANPKDSRFHPEGETDFDNPGDWQNHQSGEWR